MFHRVHNALTRSLIINTLVGGRTYRIRYAARNAVYDSGNMCACDSLRWSSTVSVLTAVRPATPLNLRHSAAPDGTGALLRYRTKLVVEWDPLTVAQLGSSPLASYTVAITDVAGTGLETQVAASALARAYAFEPLIPGQAYTFRIRATNLVGHSDWSEPTPPLYPGVEPTRPGLITFLSTTRTAITYSFDALVGQDTGGSDDHPITLVY